MVKEDTTNKEQPMITNADAEYAAENCIQMPHPADLAEVEFCGCTNTQLERGETCGQANCPTKDHTPEQRQVCAEEFSMEGAY